MNGEIEEVDVVVIGAGASGLVAAHKLQSHNASLKVVVLEAKGSLPVIIYKFYNNYHNVYNNRHQSFHCYLVYTVVFCWYFLFQRMLNNYS